jgi:membrane protein implicated in regulation of membrane protease activity
MTWETFYLYAFVIGFLLSVVSFLTGTLRIGHFHGHAHRVGVRVSGGKAGASRFNLATAAAFLAWFGGTGFLLEHYSNIWIYLGLFIAMASGLAGAAVVFWFVSKLMEHERPLDPADYEMAGVLGCVAGPIRPNGTGEVLYTRDGARKAVPARSEDSTEIPRNTEVIVTRFEKGVAYVRRWEDIS